jgi:diadenosine tetraphosphatase ApaH/serine/threonine PP2A family protein phosphatase
MRYVVLTDIHANKTALDAVLKDLGEHPPPDGQAQELFFLGDIIGYGPDPIYCLQWLNAAQEDLPKHWVPGNHDDWLRRDKIMSESEPDLVRHYGEEIRNLISEADGEGEDALLSFQKHRDELAQPANENIRAWFLGQLTEKTTDDAGTMLRRDFPSGRAAVFVHGALMPALRLDHYIKCWEEQSLLAQFRDLREVVGRETTAAVLFCGHNHFTFWAEYCAPNAHRLRSICYGERVPLNEGLTIINPGSVGQPRDGDPRAAYALFDPTAWTIEFRRVPYSIEVATKRLSLLDYPSTLGPRLESAFSNWTPEYEEVYQRPQWDLKSKGDDWVKSSKTPARS